jgi:uncharacterized membrane protein
MVAGKVAHKAGSLVRSALGASSPSRISTSLRRGVATSSRTANTGTGRAILGLGALALPVSFSMLYVNLLADRYRHTSTTIVYTSIQPVDRMYWTKLPPMTSTQLIPINHRPKSHRMTKTAREKKVKSKSAMCLPRRKATKSG